MKSVKEERMMILTMVQDGKITANEAAVLLRELSDVHAESSEMKEKVQEFSKSVEHFAKDVGSKVCEKAKKYEPKLKDMLKVTIEKTVGVLENMHNSLNKEEEGIFEDIEEAITEFVDEEEKPTDEV